MHLGVDLLVKLITLTSACQFKNASFSIGFGTLKMPQHRQLQSTGLFGYKPEMNPFLWRMHDFFINPPRKYFVMVEHWYDL